MSINPTKHVIWGYLLCAHFLLRMPAGGVSVSFLHVAIENVVADHSGPLIWVDWCISTAADAAKPASWCCYTGDGTLMHSFCALYEGLWRCRSGSPTIHAKL